MRYLITLRLDPHDATLAYARALVEPYGLNVDTDCGLVSIQGEGPGSAVRRCQ